MTKIFDGLSIKHPPPSLLPSPGIRPRVEMALLIVVICIAAFFRLYHLGEPAFRADTMIFFDYAHQPISPVDVAIKWMKNQGITGQFPFAVAWMKLFLTITSAPLTPFMIRLPSALWGIFAALAIYGCGRVLAGNAFALFLAALFAVNPFHIGISREAYFYPPLVCGSALLLWAIFLQIRAGRNKETLPGAFYILLASGFFLTTYSQPSSWTFAFTAVLVILWFQIKISWQSHRILRSLIWIALVLTIIGIPLLFADWALPQMISSSSVEIKAYVKRVFGTSSESAFITLARSLFSFGWGRTISRALFTIIVLVLSVATAIRLWRRSAVMPTIFVLLAGNFLFFAASRYLLLEHATSSRYLLALLPLYLIWLALGLWFTFDILCGLGKPNRRVTPGNAELHTKKNLSKSGCHSHACPPQARENGNPEQEKIRNWIPAGAGMTGTICAGKFQGWIAAAISIGIMAIALGLNIWPAYLATQLTGKPIPYWDIVRWCDSHLSARSLVLVERWLDPWNELRVHNSTNVYFTFTVPSEPADVFKQMNWPLTARQFMEKFPDAAYLEYSRAGRQRMGIVTNWSFARSVSFTNAAAIRLAQLGLAHREEFFAPNADRLIATVFYNSRADVLNQARVAGKRYLALYGPEWGYVKLWQQLKDFRDWRILEKQAVLDVYNLTASTNAVTLKLRGMALNGSKRVFAEGVSAGGGYHDFRHLQLEEWALKDIALRPGLNKIVFSDSLWSVAKIPLLIDQVEVFPSP